MLILRAGLEGAVGLAIIATWQSTSVGYPIEVAMLRGLLAFIAGSLVAYAAELVVLTAPPVHRPRTLEDDDALLDDDEDPHPVSLTAVRAERDAAVDESRAA